MFRECTAMHARTRCMVCLAPLDSMCCAPMGIFKMKCESPHTERGGFTCSILLPLFRSRPFTGRTHGVSNTFREHHIFSSGMRTEFFLDMVCREPYTAACSPDLPRRQRTPPWSLMNLARDADTDGARGLLQYSGESAALFVLDNVFVRRARRLHEVSPCASSSPGCSRHPTIPGG